MFGDSGKKDRETYHENILHTIIEAGQADVFILSLCDTIKRLIVDKLHIVGDIFDRGARPDIVLDDLMMHHGVDIQWGNHDILWMGAASGSMACIAAALNNAFSYGNLDTIEVGYGISLRDLSLLQRMFTAAEMLNALCRKVLLRIRPTPQTIRCLLPICTRRLPLFSLSLKVSLSAAILTLI